MFRRRPLMRAAVIGGGAYVAGKHVANKSAQQAQADADQDARISDLEQQQPDAAPPLRPRQQFRPRQPLRRQPSRPCLTS